MPLERPRRRLIPAAALLLPGCMWLRAEPAPAPEADVLETLEAEVQVSLLWSDPVDLDLYVTDPDLETVYFANNPSGSGGILKKDIKCPDVEKQDEGRSLVETAYWKKARPGRYRVGVDFIDGCDSRLEDTEFRVVVKTGDATIEEVASARLERFEPLVLEFEHPTEEPQTEAP